MLLSFDVYLHIDVYSLHKRQNDQKEENGLKNFYRTGLNLGSVAYIISGKFKFSFSGYVDNNNINNGNNTKSITMLALVLS